MPIAKANYNADAVTPYKGVWIEIVRLKISRSLLLVTPYKGVWIEMFSSFSLSLRHQSLPTRECGLKYQPVGRT